MRILFECCCFLILVVVSMYLIFGDCLFCIGLSKFSQDNPYILIGAIIFSTLFPMFIMLSWYNWVKIKATKIQKNRKELENE